MRNRKFQIDDRYRNGNGMDMFMLPDDSPFAYRVPDQSVVNKLGDLKLCGRISLTAAQWIW